MFVAYIHKTFLFFSVVLLVDVVGYFFFLFFLCLFSFSIWPENNTIEQINSNGTMFCFEYYSICRFIFFLFRFTFFCFCTFIKVVGLAFRPWIVQRDYRYQMDVYVFFGKSLLIRKDLFY